MEQWWNEYIKGVKRDQLSLCYVLWKNGYTANDVSIIGKNSRNNNYFEIDNHSCK